jgi:hypothetical protein
MSDNKSSYGHLTSGKVVLASDFPGPIDLTAWTPGTISPDGKFHPDDPGKRAASGRWVVEFRDIARAADGPEQMSVVPSN